MASTNFDSALTRLPAHLRSFVVEQGWDRYSAIDHAAWRYIMRQSVRILGERAHPIYLDGLRRTGISLEAIPRIEEMNAILARLGWSAVTVDGFIPPAAFMEFQALRVLVITAEMRQLDHIEYTPAPDIVHEAAGHAPIIADPHYANYLAQFGEVGSRAIASLRDYELYEAIRNLSVVKELPTATPAEIAAAEQLVTERQAALGAPSELARLSRLHWWSVEYGLVGELRRPRLYGAGLLSSIGEAVSCLEPKVRKLPYDVSAADYAYDITTRQPQLFVTPDFEHLSRVLDDFAATMAFRLGGAAGLARAIESEREATAVYSSGLQVSGTFVEVIRDGRGAPAYVRTRGPSALACGGRELPGHGPERHADGFGSPVGRLEGSATPLEELGDSALERLGIAVGRGAHLRFESGIEVHGRVETILRRGGKVLLITFQGCRASLGDKTLFAPEWGAYDMAVGATIPSVFGGWADRDARVPEAAKPAQRTERVAPDARTRALQALYARVRDIREGRRPRDDARAIWTALQREYPGDWLAALELLEMGADVGLGAEVRAKLERQSIEQPQLARLIGDGLALVAGADITGEAHA